MCGCGGCGFIDAGVVVYGRCSCGGVHDGCGFDFIDGKGVHLSVVSRDGCDVVVAVDDIAGKIQVVLCEGCVGAVGADAAMPAEVILFELMERGEFSCFWLWCQFPGWTEGFDRTCGSGGSTHMCRRGVVTVCGDFRLWVNFCGSWRELAEVYGS